MPGKCGEDVLREVSSNRDGRIVTVICSARSGFGRLPNGAFEVIAKPFEVHTILNAVARAFLHLEAIGHRFDE